MLYANFCIVPFLCVGDEWGDGSAAIDGRVRCENGHLRASQVRQIQSFFALTVLHDVLTATLLGSESRESLWWQPQPASMAFQAQTSDNQQQQHPQAQIQYGQPNLDSITLGQLRNMANVPPKPKVCPYSRIPIII